MNEKLNAINSCLAGSGLAPVASVDDPDLDAGMASQTIDRVTREMLGAGMWFNREPNWKLAPEEFTGVVNLPSSAMAIEPEGVDRLKKFVIRSRKVYDMDRHTYDLRDSSSDGFIYLTIIQDLPFEDLPTIVIDAITAKARRLFAQDSEVDQARWNFQIRDEQEAMEKVYIHDARTKKGNYLRDNQSAKAHINRIGGWNSVSGLKSLPGKRYN